MAKRFTDTELWDKGWFMDLPPRLKCLVKMVRDKADLSGVWDPNWRIANMLIGEPVTEEELLSIDGGQQFKKLPGGKIFCLGFVEFQYGILSEKSPVHRKVLNILANHKIPYKYPINRGQEEEEDKEDEEEEQGGAGGSEQEASKLLVPQMLSVFREHLPNYAASHGKDFPALYDIAAFLSEQIGSGPPLANTGPVLAEWRKICEYLSNPENFYHTKSLKTISTHIQEIFQRHEQPKRNSKKNGLGAKSGGFGILNEVERKIGLLGPEDD